MFSPRIKLLLITSIISLSGSFHFGYLIVVPNPAMSAFQNFINDSFYDHHSVYLYEKEFRYFWPFFLNLITIGGIFGSLLLRYLADNLGRVRSFYAAAIFQIIGCVASTFSLMVGSWELLSLGRLSSGISVGITLGLQPMYFTEISPKAVRGLMNGMTGTALEFGFVFGAVIALPVVFGSAELWPWIFGLETVIALTTFLTYPFILRESPKYILASTGDYDKAKESLIFFKHENVEQDIKEIEEEIKSEKIKIGVIAIFKKPYLRRALTIGSLTIAACMWSGIGAISLYSTYIFEQAGVPGPIAPYATVMVTFMAFLAAIISSFVVDHVGKRPLILVSLISLAALNLIFVIFMLIGTHTGATWPGYVCVVENIIFTFMFGIGPAVVQWSIVAELMPQNARSAATSFVQGVQWISGFAANTIFYPLQGAINEWSIFMFIIPLVVVSVYLYFTFPETKNKSTLEIMKSLGYVEEDEDSTKKMDKDEMKTLIPP